MKITLKMDVGVEFTQNIAGALPDNKNSEELFHELAQHSSSKVRQEIAYKDTLSEDTAKLLLQDNETSVLENILRSRSISSIITDEDIDRIISIGNLECIENILSNLSNYELVSQENTFHKLLELNNLDLTIAVADNYDSPKKILKMLTKHSDPDIAMKAKTSLE